MPKKKLLIFLSHASEDRPLVRKLYKQLSTDGFDPWLDENRLLPGQDWNFEIEQALRKCDSILLCFSAHSISKEGYIQREYKRAMDYRLEKPEGSIFVIPVRLDDCEIPFFLRELQCVNYPSGYKKLVLSLNVRAGKAPINRKSLKRAVAKRNTTKIDAKDSSIQLSTGGIATNIQTQTFIEKQVIHQTKELGKVLENHNRESVEFSTSHDPGEKLNYGSRVRFLDALDSARFSSQLLFSESGLFSILYVKAQLFLAMINGDSIVISDNQLFDSFGFLEAFSELYSVAQDVDFEKELPIKVALREDNKDVYQVVATHIGNKSYFLTLWKDLNGDADRRNLWAYHIRNKQKPPAEIVLADEKPLLDKLWIILEYFNSERCVSAENIPEEFSKRVKRVMELSDDVLNSLCTGINMGVEQRMYFDSWSEVEAAKKIRDALCEIQEKVGEIKSRSLIRREIVHYQSEELREGVIEVTDNIYNQILGIATGATLVQSSIFPPRKNEFVAAGYSLSTYLKDTSNPFNQYVDWEVFSFDYFENLQRLDDPARKAEIIRILDAARKNAPWEKTIEMQRNEDWQSSLNKFRESLTRLQGAVKLYKLGSLPRPHREKLEKNLSDYQVELKKNWTSHIENVRQMTSNDYWHITSTEISFTDPDVYYSVRIPYSHLKPKIDMEYIDGIKSWRNHKAFKGRLDDRIDSSG